MKKTKKITMLWALAGLVLALLAMLGSLFGHSIQPILLGNPTGAAECAAGMMARVAAGDFEGAAAFFCGNPVLRDGEDTTEQLLREAYSEGFRYEVTGRPTAEGDGLALPVAVQTLEIPSVTGRLGLRARELLAQRVDSAEDMAQVYDEAHHYRQDFVQSVLHDAVEQAIAEDGRYARRELVLKLIYHDNRWQILPEAAVMNALAGGVLNEKLAG